MQGLRSQQSIQEVYGELDEHEEAHEEEEEEVNPGEDRGPASVSCSGRSKMLRTEKLNLVAAAITILVRKIRVCFA